MPKRKMDSLTPGELYQRIAALFAIINESNDRLRAMGARTVDICTTADAPPFTWVLKRKRP